MRTGINVPTKAITAAPAIIRPILIIPKFSIWKPKFPAISVLRYWQMKIEATIEITIQIAETNPDSEKKILNKSLRFVL